VGEYMIRPVLALERLTFLESEGKVGDLASGKGAAPETMDYLCRRTKNHRRRIARHRKKVLDFYYGNLIVFRGIVYIQRSIS